MSSSTDEIAGNDVMFFEPYAAAQSLKSGWTRMASTYGCIMVVLSREVLTIKPHWLARWLIGLLRLDLYHEIPIANIKDVMDRGTWFSHGKIEVQFVTRRGENRRILLYVKHYRGFIDSVTNMIGQ